MNTTLEDINFFLANCRGKKEKNEKGDEIHNINLRHTYKGLSCDIAVDFEEILHPYHIYDEFDTETQIPIEFYCFDREEWGISVRFVKIERDSRYYGRIIPTDECIRLCEEWVDKMLEEE